METKTTALADELTKHLDEAALLADLSELVRIPSVNPFDDDPAPGFQEQELAEFYGQRMRKLGLEVEFREVAPERPIVWGRLRGTGNGPSVMLAGHMDTVGVPRYEGDPFDPKVADGKLYGRGSCDMKAALAAYLEVVRLLRTGGVELGGDLIIAGVPDEEYQLIGSKEMGKHGPWADFGIIGEPTDLKVCPAHKGQFSLFLRTFGKAAHSSVPELGENAIERMAQVVLAFADYNEELQQREPHALCGHGTFSPGVIRGGDIVAAVPDLCELEVDRRILPGETAEDVVGDYRVRLEALVRNHPGLRYEISEPSWYIPSLDLPLDSPVVTGIARAYESVVGKPATVTAFSAATDAPNLGFPTVVCGPGSLAQAHTTCEYVRTAEVVDATKIYLHTVLGLSGG